eukprot:1182336-Prorocentrum_minimum.AAC.1
MGRQTRAHAPMPSRNPAGGQNLSSGEISLRALSPEGALTLGPCTVGTSAQRGLGTLVHAQ